jgi:hypothetical protein
MYLFALELAPTLVVEPGVKLAKHFEVDEVDEAIAHIAVILGKGRCTLMSQGR